MGRDLCTPAEERCGVSCLLNCIYETCWSILWNSQQCRLNSFFCSLIFLWSTNLVAAKIISLILIFLNRKGRHSIIAWSLWLSYISSKLQVSHKSEIKWIPCKSHNRDDKSRLNTILRCTQKGRAFCCMRLVYVP